MFARTPKDLGLLIRDRRRTLQLDQRELAKRVGVSRQWIVEVEGGKPRAEIGLVLRTLTALGLHLDIRASDPAPETPGIEVDLDAVLARATKPKP